GDPDIRPGQHVVDLLGEEEAADERDRKRDQRLDQPRAQLDQMLDQRRLGGLDVFVAHAVRLRSAGGGGAKSFSVTAGAGSGSGSMGSAGGVLAGSPTTASAGGAGGASAAGGGAVVAGGSDGFHSVLSFKSPSGSKLALSLPVASSMSFLRSAISASRIASRN